ncbi:basic salivary proline-rich protein 2-like [Canis lupus familiaris]|uniref:basic salivary proline-rich protein 2-like n=1 Tax=Canis lupus familiaris TaxID=9615 RepID=UPI0018F7D66D|nr:basic salivary proline-rich protein 2-like [Canis lupus familiaris]
MVTITATNVSEASFTQGARTPPSTVQFGRTPGNERGRAPPAGLRAPPVLGSFRLLEHPASSARRSPPPLCRTLGPCGVAGRGGANSRNVHPSESGLAGAVLAGLRRARSPHPPPGPDRAISLGCSSEVKRGQRLAPKDPEPPPRPPARRPSPFPSPPPGCCCGRPRAPRPAPRAPRPASPPRAAVSPQRPWRVAAGAGRRGRHGAGKPAAPPRAPPPPPTAGRAAPSAPRSAQTEQPPLQCQQPQRRRRERQRLGPRGSRQRGTARRARTARARGHLAASGALRAALRPRRGLGLGASPATAAHKGPRTAGCGGCARGPGRRPAAPRQAAGARAGAGRVL